MSRSSILLLSFFGVLYFCGRSLLNCHFLSPAVVQSDKMSQWVNSCRLIWNESCIKFRNSERRAEFPAKPAYGKKKSEHLGDQENIIIPSRRARMQGGLLDAVNWDSFVGSWKNVSDLRVIIYWMLATLIEKTCSAETLEEVSASINKSKQLKSWNYEKTRGQLLIYGVEGHGLELFDAFIVSLSLSLSLLPV